MHINEDLNKMSKQKFKSTRVIIYCGSIILTVKSVFFFAVKISPAMHSLRCLFVFFTPK